MLAQPAELIARGGEVAACAEEEREEGVDAACVTEEGGGEAGHSFVEIAEVDGWR